MQVKKLSDEDIAATTELIESISYQNFSATTVTDIVVEELESYYNDDKSLDEVIEIISARVGKYINEN